MTQLASSSLVPPVTSTDLIAGLKREPQWPTAARSTVAFVALEHGACSV